MHPSLRLFSGSGRKPLIHFIGKRNWPSTPEPSHAHPAAPAELKALFSDFQRKFESNIPAAAGKHDVSSSSSPAHERDFHSDFWEAPSRFWKPRIRELNEAEIELISSGGASLY